MPTRIGALISVASLAVLVSIPPATAQTSRNANGAYSVNDLVLGAKVQPDSAQLRDYRCGPSEQFDGFTWCQRNRQDRDRDRRGTSSLLHGRDGKIAYLNRQEPSSLDGREIEDEIRSYTRRLGSQPRISRMPRRAGGPEGGVMAMWGQVDIEPLDADSMRILADGKSPRKGFLVDYLGNLTRSAQDGLPVFRITGGAGLIWVASYDQRGRGTLRITAVDTSVLSPPVAATPASPPAVADAPASSPETEPSTEHGQTTLADAGDNTPASEPTVDVPRLNAPPEVQATADAAPTALAGESTPQTANERAAADAEIARLRFAVGVSYSLIGGLLLLLAAVFGRLLIEKRRLRLERQARGSAPATSFAPASGNKARLPVEAMIPPQPSAQAPKAAVVPAAAPVTVARHAATPAEQVHSNVPPNAAPVVSAPAPMPAPASTISQPDPAAASAPVVQTGSLSIVPEDALDHLEAPEIARATQDDSIQRLAELSKLHASGALTETEFNQLKSAIIATVSGTHPASP